MANRSVQSEGVRLAVSPIWSAQLARRRLQFPTTLPPVLSQLCDESLFVCTRWWHLLNELRRLHRQLRLPRRSHKEAEASGLAAFGYGVLSFLICIVRAPLVLILAFLEPFVRLVLMGMAVLGVLTAIMYRASGVAPHFPFWPMLGMSFGCVLLLAIYHAILRFLAR